MNTHHRRASLHLAVGGQAAELEEVVMVVELTIAWSAIFGASFDAALLDYHCRLTRLFPPPTSHNAPVLDSARGKVDQGRNHHQSQLAVIGGRERPWLQF